MTSCFTGWNWKLSDGMFVQCWRSEQKQVFSIRRISNFLQCFVVVWKFVSLFINEHIDDVAPIYPHKHWFVEKSSKVNCQNNEHNDKSCWTKCDSCGCCCVKRHCCCFDSFIHSVQPFIRSFTQSAHHVKVRAILFYQWPVWQFVPVHCLTNTVCWVFHPPRNFSVNNFQVFLQHFEENHIVAKYFIFYSKEFGIFSSWC